MSQVKELRSLTGLRGVAAVSVMVFHYWPFVAPTAALSTLLSHGYLAVDLFFVLSGFVMALNYAQLFNQGWSSKAFKTFLIRRIARVYPLYLLTTVIALLLINKGWLGWHEHQPLGPAFLANLAMIQSWGFGGSLDGPGWSISAEWAAYLLFPGILWTAYNSSAMRTKIVTSISVLVLFALSALHSSIFALSPSANLDYSNATFGIPVFRCLAEFTLGVVAARLFMQHRRQWQGRHLTDYCTVVLCVLACVLRTDFFIVLLFPVWIICLASGSSVTGRVLSSSICHHLGLLSYSIYLIHDLFAGLLVWTHAFANSKGLDHGQTYGGLVCLVLTYGTALLMYSFIETPARESVRVLFEGRRTAIPLERQTSSVNV